VNWIGGARALSQSDRHHLFVISFFGSLIGLRYVRIESPLAAIALEVAFIGWAIAIRWRVVAGALCGLLVCELTPSLDAPPDIIRMVMWMAIGAMLGFASEELGERHQSRRIMRVRPLHRQVHNP
jgi:hypothetical protein